MVEAGDDVDLQWRALGRKAELGGETAAEVRLLLDRDPDPDAWVRTLAVRAATPDAAEKRAVWQALTADRTVPVSWVDQIAGAFWRPGQEHLLAPYAQRYLDLVPHLHRGRMIEAMVFTSRLFPLYAVDQAFLERAKAAATHAAPVVGKTLLERADLVQRILRSRG
jgi:aminopeptidase N